MAEEDLDSTSQYSGAPQTFVTIDECQGLRLDVKKDSESEVTIIEQLKTSDASNLKRKNEEEDGNYIIHVGVGEASKQIFEDFVKMKQTQNFNSNPDFLKWLLNVRETPVLESSNSTNKDVKNGGRKKIDKTNITEDFVVAEVCRKKIDDTNIMEDLIVVEDDEYGGFIISSEQQVGKEGSNLNSPAIGNSCDEVNTAKKSSDEILYDRFIKHLTKRKEAVQKEKDMENKSNKTNKRIINVNVKVLVEDTEFPRVVEQAKCIQHNSSFEIDLSSVKKLRQFPSKFTKFDKERHEELEKLERTVNKNNIVTDESPKKQNNGKGVKRKTQLPAVITIPIKVQAPVTDIQAKLIESKQLISIPRLNEKIPVALETEEDSEVKNV